MQEILNQSLRSDLPVGEWIRKNRQAQGISRKQLAEATGLSEGYIGDLERGKSNPSLQALYAITKALRVSIEDLSR